jgi:hypothetical protein
MSERQWKYIDGPVVHELTTYQGDHAIFALWCTGERIQKASYVEAGTTCLACAAASEPVIKMEGFTPFTTNPCVEVPISLDWFQYLDSKDGLVHDVRRYALTNDMHVSRCHPNDPMYPPKLVDEPLTCLWCVALRNSDPEFFTHQEEGRAVFNASALQKIKFNF